MNKLFVHDNKQIEEEAYFELCDLLILFNKHLSESYKPIVIECLPNDINMLILYCINNVYTQIEATEQADTSDKIEKLHKRRRILSAFCKLIVYNTIPTRYMADICRGYLKYSSSYGDIIKQTLVACRDISKLNMSKTISLALQREFNELIANQTLSGGGDSLVDTEEFGQIKELSRKFLFLFTVTGSGSGSSDALRQTRESLIEFHMDGIKYVNEQLQQNVGQQAYVSFFAITNEFILNKYLTNQDKKLLIKQLTLPQSTVTQKANKNDLDSWKPYFDYRDALVAATSLSEPSAASVAATAAAESEAAASTTTAPPLLSSTMMLDSRKRKQGGGTAASDLSSISSIQNTTNVASNSRIEITKLNQLTINDNTTAATVGGANRKRSRSPIDDDNKNDENGNGDEDGEDDDDDGEENDDGGEEDGGGDEGEDGSTTIKSSDDQNSSTNHSNNRSKPPTSVKRIRTSNSPKVSESRPSFVKSIMQDRK